MSGSAIVPCGGDPSRSTFHTISTYFQAFGAGTTQATLDAHAAPHVSVTGSNPLGTDDTTSYAHADLAGYANADRIHDTVIGISGNAQSTVTIPPDATEVDVTAVAVMRRTQTSGVGASQVSIGLSALDPSAGTLIHSFGSTVLFLGVTDPFTRFTWSIGDTDPASWTTPLGELACILSVAPNDGADLTGDLWDVAYLGLVVQWVTPGVATLVQPFLRHNQRHDGLAGSPIAHNQTRSVQSTIRHNSFR